jgi:hemerythrin-like domain-containing protein
MQATDILMSEHRVIEQVLACLEKMAKECLAEGTLDLRAARQAIDFFQTFADRCHHSKEEQQLFPLLEAHGFACEHGPIGRMLYEHTVGRHYLRALADAAEAAAPGDENSLYRFADQVRSYVYWLREHIAKEDQHLFPLANRVLTEADQQALWRSFETMEHDDMGTGTHEVYLQIANELADRYGVPQAHPEDTSAAGCTACGHGVSR